MTDSDKPATRSDESVADSEAVAHLRADPVLSPLVDEHGPLSIERADDPFERLVVAILRQQVSMASAAAIRRRLFDACEVTPAGILATDERVLREAGLSRQKATYVRNVADAFLEHEYDDETFAAMGDEAVIDELTAIGGVGVWTAKMFLIFVLGRPDVFPVEDLGIRHGMRALFDDDLTRAEMTDEAERWRPYRSLASLYVWRAVD